MALVIRVASVAFITDALVALVSRVGSQQNLCVLLVALRFSASLAPTLKRAAHRNVSSCVCATVEVDSAPVGIAESSLRTRAVARAGSAGGHVRLRHGVSNARRAGRKSLPLGKLERQRLRRRSCGQERACDVAQSSHLELRRIEIVGLSYAIARIGPQGRRLVNGASSHTGRVCTSRGGVSGVENGSRLRQRQDREGLVANIAARNANTEEARNTRRFSAECLVKKRIAAACSMSL